MGRAMACHLLSEPVIEVRLPESGLGQGFWKGNEMKKFLTYVMNSSLYLTSASIFALSPPAPPLPTIADRVNTSTDVFIGTPQQIVLIDVDDNILDSKQEVGAVYKRVAIVVVVDTILYSKKSSGYTPTLLISFSSIGKSEKRQVEHYLGKNLVFVVDRFKRNIKGRGEVEASAVLMDPIALDTPAWKELTDAVRNRLENDSKSNEAKKP